MSDPSPAATVTITLDGRALRGEAGASVASLLMANGVLTLRRSPRAGTPRGAFCLMGVCQECTLSVGGVQRQACLVPAENGMRVSRPDLGP